jgi:hypothetical protein
MTIGQTLIHGTDLSTGFSGEAADMATWLAPQLEAEGMEAVRDTLLPGGVTRGEAVSEAALPSTFYA